MNLIGTIYLIFGVLFALYSEYELNQAKNHPLASLLPQPTGIQRLMNAFLMVFLWPLAIIKLMLK